MPTSVAVACFTASAAERAAEAAAEAAAAAGGAPVVASSSLPEKQQQQQEEKSRSPPTPLSSAPAAVAALRAIRAAVLSEQLRLALLSDSGSVPATLPGGSCSAAVDIASSSVSEGDAVEIEDPRACTVAFARGQE